ncbi:NADPH:quinone reductase [Actinorhabdospora filicis]|uniref:NADPH:quinone reductase n=1 Tax=Actinorhabdospora filicis TaxID=1785913 RepID=A0A9W6SIA5_9ACTN|nr:zinc-binding dehydrogenase [Actinorhabdospora filicis]GLZ77605.1 NADPH:quinone reductase [Actinorhabdospora filicis]
MRALRQVSHEGPKDLTYVEDVEVPTPGPGEVLLRVTSAGVNFADVSQTYGIYDGGPDAPYIAGFEVTGEIVGGDGEVGKHVIGFGNGAFAEYTVAPAAALMPIPEGWRDEQALGLVLNWATALAALKPLGRLAEGETVLIHAAAGGVGQAAVRMAKHYGARVIATASPAKHEAVRALGADVVLDYHGDQEGVAAAVNELGGADLVLESVGGETFAASLAAAKPVVGRVVVFGAVAGNASVSNWELIFKYRVSVIGLHIGALPQHAPEVYGWIMSEIERLREEGVYLPNDPTIYKLRDGARALKDLEGRGTVGKLAIVP